MNIKYREFYKNEWRELALIGDEQCKISVLHSAMFLQTYDGNVTKCYVAEDENQIVGFIYGFVLPNGTIIPELLFVKQEYRKNGIGAELLSFFESNSGGSTSMIYFNKSLHTFYESKGYLIGSELEVGLKEIRSGR